MIAYETVLKEEFMSQTIDMLTTLIPVDGYELFWIEDQLHYLQSVQDENIVFTAQELNIVFRLITEVEDLLQQSLHQNLQYENRSNVVTLFEFRQEILIHHKAFVRRQIVV